MQTVRTHAQSLLSSIGVSRIVVVDDEYSEVEVETLIGLCSELDPELAATLPHLNSIDFRADREIWADSVRDCWGALNTAARESVLAQASAFQPEASPTDEDFTDPTTGQVDTEVAKSLEEILDKLEACEYVPLSLTQWRERGNELLTDNRAENTVFLFDRDFTREDGTENEGIELIRQVQHANVGYCGVFSHTFTVEGEHNAWRHLTAEHDLDQDTFIVIAKERLTSESPDYYQFLRMLRLVGLSGRYANVKLKTWWIFKKSVAEAEVAVERLSVPDFDRIVFGSSRREGVWEPDTLFRVFGILMRRAARRRLHQDDELFSHVSDARRISTISEKLAGALGEERASPEALRIQRFESYESAGDFNQFHFPIELGDIFEKISTRRRYILLAQPCDLMVRGNGKRSYDNKCRRTGAFVELVVNPGNRKDGWGVLPFYDEDTGGSAFANFAKVHQALLAVLDLCALRADGVAKIDVGAACPDLVIQPWKARYKRLVSFFSRALDRYEQLRNEQLRNRRLANDLNLLVLPRLSATVGHRATVDNRTVEYDLKRVMRLRQPWSGALFTSFAQYQARAAFKHPFDHRVHTQLEPSGNQEPENHGDVDATE